MRFVEEDLRLPAVYHSVQRYRPLFLQKSGSRLLNKIQNLFSNIITTQIILQVCNYSTTSKDDALNSKRALNTSPKAGSAQV